MVNPIKVLQSQKNREMGLKVLKGTKLSDVSTIAPLILLAFVRNPL